MNGLLIVLVVLMAVFVVMLIVMTISIIKLTRQIHQTQQKVEAMTQRISGFGGIASAVSIGIGLAKNLTSRHGFLAKYFTKKKAGNGRKTNQKTTK